MRILKPKQDFAFLPDPSSIYRPEITYNSSVQNFEPGKYVCNFRNYEENVHTDIVRRTYREMHINQSYSFVQEKRMKWLQFNHAKMTIMEAVALLDDLVDESDPDIDLPNSVHAFQTGERIREKYPMEGWFQLTGLIHDLGKVLALWGEPQWCVVGDTFPVGCKFQDSCVFPEYFSENPDHHNPLYNTDNGIYKEHCGLDQITMSWGHDVVLLPHPLVFVLVSEPRDEMQSCSECLSKLFSAFDCGVIMKSKKMKIYLSRHPLFEQKEYLYQVLKGHPSCQLPDQSLYMIRFHSFYPYHTGGSFKHLCNEKDQQLLFCLQDFNSFDLYSKSDSIPDVELLKPYYQSLIDQYIPGELKW